uniref:Uncharacterized protein n=1 Tax=Romanomermis culicivorax TaxID=13658 RepID=A0A915HP53_ROMCU
MYLANLTQYCHCFKAAAASTVIPGCEDDVEEKYSTNLLNKGRRNEVKLIVQSTYKFYKKTE